MGIAALIMTVAVAAAGLEVRLVPPGKVAEVRAIGEPDADRRACTEQAVREAEKSRGFGTVTQNRTVYFPLDAEPGPVGDRVALSRSLLMKLVECRRIEVLRHCHAVVEQEPCSSSVRLPLTGLIEADGAVFGSSAGPVEFEMCVRKRMRDWRFPAREGKTEDFELHLMTLEGAPCSDPPTMGSLTPMTEAVAEDRSWPLVLFGVALTAALVIVARLLIRRRRRTSDEP